MQMDKIERKEWAVGEHLRRILPRYAPFFKHLPYLWEYDDNTIRCRDNELMVSLEIQGIDANTSTEVDISLLRRQFADVLKSLDDRWTFYIHRLTRPVKMQTKPIEGDTFQAAIDRRWKKHLQASNPRNTMIVLTVVRGRNEPLRWPFFRKLANKMIKDDVAQRRRSLDEIVSILGTALGGVKLRKLSIKDGSLIGFLGAINTGSYKPVQRQTLSFISEDASSVSARFWPDVIEIFEGFETTRWATVIYVKAYPTSTTPAMLDAFDGMENVVVTQSYTPVAQHMISEQAQRRIQQMQAAGDVARRAMQDLMEAADDLESNLLGFGTHHMAITVHAESKEELAQQVSNIIGLGKQAGLELDRDKFALEAMYFANHPGNMRYRARRSIISAVNFSDMASFHTENLGDTNRLPWKQPVAMLPTAKGNMHHFSFHPPVATENSEPSNGHTLVLGPSESGKTTTTLFLVMQAMRAAKRVILFDKDRAMRMAVLAAGGQYAAVQAGHATGLNPLMTETGPRGQAWLMEWFTALLEQTGENLTPWQSQTLKQAIRQNCETTDNLRNFGNFQDLIGDTNDNGALAARVSEWGPNGRYSWVFGEAGSALVDFSKNRITAVDLTEILKLGTERTALLGYLFRVIELQTEDRQPTIILIDEAWQALNDTYFASMLSEWLVTARKKNVVVIMLTQFPSQIRESRVKTILEGLPNRLLFPNAKAEETQYEGFGLNAAETGFLLGGQLPGMRTALWRNHTSSTLLNVDIGCLGSLLTALGGGGAGEERFGADYATRPDFWKEDKINA